MSSFSVGDLVLLKSGSMRMVVEAVEEDGAVSTVWCHDGVIGRERFDPLLLNKAEDRSERSHHGGRGDRDDRGGYQGRGGGFRGDRDRDDNRGNWGGGHGGHGGHRGRDRDRDDNRYDDRPPRKQGWDGKPRDKKYYRKDD